MPRASHSHRMAWRQKCPFERAQCWPHSALLRPEEVGVQLPWDAAHPGAWGCPRRQQLCNAHQEMLQLPQGCRRKESLCAKLKEQLHPCRHHPPALSWAVGKLWQSAPGQAAPAQGHRDGQGLRGLECSFPLQWGMEEQRMLMAKAADSAWGHGTHPVPKAQHSSHTSTWHSQPGEILICLQKGGCSRVLPKPDSQKGHAPRLCLILRGDAQWGPRASPPVTAQSLSFHLKRHSKHLKVT